MMESAAARRERGDLGGWITLPECDPIPCCFGPDTSGLQRADNSAGFQFNQMRRAIVRTSLLKDIPRQPAAGDTVTVRGNLETEDSILVISPSNGIEGFNAILTAINLYNPNA